MKLYISIYISEKETDGKIGEKLFLGPVLKYHLNRLDVTE